MVANVFQMVLAVSHVYASLPIQVNGVRMVMNRGYRNNRFYCIIYLANPCANNPCGPNGQCVQSGGGFYCECNLGYYGNRCERECYTLFIAHSM